MKQYLVTKNCILTMHENYIKCVCKHMLFYNLYIQIVCCINYNLQTYYKKQLTFKIKSYVTDV